MGSSQPKNKPHRSVIHRLARVFLKIILTIFIILILVIFLIQTPYVQNIIRGKAESYLSRKLKTRITIGKIFIKFPESIEIKNIYIEDRQKDTLLSAGTILVDIHMWKLLHNNVDIAELQLKDLTVKVKRQLPDTVFNFQFIADAFAGAPDTTTKKPSSPMKMALRKIMLDKIRLVYKDVVTGNDVEVWIENSETKMETFDPTALHFNVSDFYMNGLRARIFQTQPLIPAPLPAQAPGGGGSFIRRAGQWTSCRRRAAKFTGNRPLRRAAAGHGRCRLAIAIGADPAGTQSARLSQYGQCLLHESAAGPPNRRHENVRPYHQDRQHQ